MAKKKRSASKKVVHRPRRTSGESTPLRAGAKKVRRVHDLKSGKVLPLRPTVELRPDIYEYVDRLVEATTPSEVLRVLLRLDVGL